MLSGFLVLKRQVRDKLIRTARGIGSPPPPPPSASVLRYLANKVGGGFDRALVVGNPTAAPR